MTTLPLVLQYNDITCSWRFLLKNLAEHTSETIYTLSYFTFLIPKHSLRFFLHVHTFPSGVTVTSQQAIPDCIAVKETCAVHIADVVHCRPSYAARVVQLHQIRWSVGSRGSRDDITQGLILGVALILRDFELVVKLYFLHQSGNFVYHCQ